MKKKYYRYFLLIVVLILLTTVFVGCDNKNNVYNNNYVIDNMSYAYKTATDKAKLSSVIIKNKVGDSLSSGSGVVLSSDGYVLTNDHVIKSSGNIQVGVFHKGDIVNVKASPVSEIRDGSKYYDMDMAILKLDSAELKMKGITLTPVEFCDSKDIQFGASGIVIGNPKGIGFMVSKAMVSNPSIEIKHPNRVNKFIAIDAPVNSGNSGGGFYHIDGKLMGLVTLRTKEASDNNENIVFGIGFAIRIEDVAGYVARYDQIKRGN